MTTTLRRRSLRQPDVVEAYRLGKYDNSGGDHLVVFNLVVEAYRLGKYDNKQSNAYAASSINGEAQM